MSGRREVLFLAHRIPYPPDKGDKIRSWRLFQRLAERFDVHLGCFVDDADDLRHEAFLRSLSASAAFVPLRPMAAALRSAAALASPAPLGFALYRSRAMKSFVEKARRRPLAAEIVFSSVMAPYIELPAGAPRIVDFCDADSEKWRQYAEETHGPLRLLYRSEAKRLAKAETAVANWADAAFAVSEPEAALFNARSGMTRKILVLRNGVDADYFTPAKAAGDFAEVVFVGAMDYRPNIEGVLWFAREVWPLVRETAPAAGFAIVGRNPAPAVSHLHGEDGIAVLGRVDDVRPHLAGAAVVIAPLRIARGVQNKVLEAMAAARPVVATSVANAGVGARDGVEILLADDPAAFAGHVAAMLADRPRGDAVGRAARARVTADFQWRPQLDRFEETLSRLIAA